MKILALNCGSSSLKFQLIEIRRDNGTPASENCLVKGRISLGQRGRIEFRTSDGRRFEKEVEISSHAEAVRNLFRWPDAQAVLGTDTLQAVGHRVVHGGDEFTEPTLIDDRAMKSLEAIAQLAPLHNHPALEVICEVRSVLGNAVPMVATFDTAFHKTLPDHAKRYALPEELTTKHQLWRYGFHGLAHRWMMERYAALSGKPSAASKLITLQLGSGCSVAAIQTGRSVETSMGLTPLEGLMMATRSGDLDPSLPGWLLRREGATLEQVEEWLNTRSGLLGVSGQSGDIRVVLEAERKGDRRARLALDMFCHRVRKYVGAYLAVLGGADAILFGGGTGEAQPVIRARICLDMNWCGLLLDHKRNEAVVGSEAKISAANSAISAYVIPVNEEMLIARDAFECLDAASSVQSRS